MLKFGRISLIAVLAVLGSIVGISSAQAVGNEKNLPNGSSLFLLDTNDATGLYEMTNLGAQRPVSIQTNDQSVGYYSTAVLNPADGFIYAVLLEGDPERCKIDKLDINGGAPATRVAVLSGATQVKQCDSITIDSNGNALIEGTANNGSTYRVWRLDLTTGAATSGVTLDDGIYAFATDPGTGQWYGINFSNQLVSIDSSTGAFSSPLVTQAFDYPLDGEFDSNRTLWFTEAPASSNLQLYSWHIGDTSFTLQGDMTQNGQVGDSKLGSVFVATTFLPPLPTPTPQPVNSPSETTDTNSSLANTGLNVTVYALTGFIALLASATGIAMVTQLRRRVNK